MNGITKGLQLLADFFKLFLRAIRAGNAEAVTDGVSIIETWLRETVNTAGVVKISPVGLLLGADPWGDSRQMYRAYSAKWSDKL